MRNNTPKNSILKQLLAKRMMQEHYASDSGDFDPMDPPDIFVNSHGLYQEVEIALHAEQDIGRVRQIALDYIDSMCKTMPDDIAQGISRQMNGF